MKSSRHQCIKRRTADLHVVVRMTSSWGHRWEQERSSDWRSNGQPFVHGSVLVERHVSKSNEWVVRGCDSPLARWDGSKVRAAMKCSLPGLDEIVSMKWRASKPRRVGLHDMVVIERPHVLLAQRMGFMPSSEPLAGGMQRGRAAGPLAKRVVVPRTACVRRYLCCRTREAPGSTWLHAAIYPAL